MSSSKNNILRVHSFESFGTVDGPRYSICDFSSGLSFEM